MSENTNTLFWVICGAVIVIAIFTLVNVTSNQTINKIFKKYKNEYREIVPAKANYPLTKENWSVDIVSLINSRLTFLATNLKGKPQYVNEIDIKFFNCNTDDLITTFN